MHEYFDVLIDKWGGEYFEGFEKDAFITDALKQFVIGSIEERVGLKTGSSKTPRILSSIEGTIRGLEQIRPYIFSIYEALDDTGVIRFDRIDSGVRSYYLNEGLRGNGTYKMKFLLSLGRLGLTRYKEDVTEVHFVRHNDIYRFNRNDFKKPTVDYPVFLITSEGMEILPYNPGGTYYITGIRDTEEVFYDEENYGTIDDTSIEPTIDDSYKEDIVRKAVALAMVSLGHTEKARLIENEENY